MTTPTSTKAEIDQTLPELPEPHLKTFEVKPEEFGLPLELRSTTSYYTADQVREVATEAMATERAEVERLRAECERLLLSDKEQRALFVGQAVERAARDLPEGYELTINLERGAGWVEWTNDQGNTMGIEADGEPFHQQINSAIESAIKEAGNGDD